MESLVYGSVSKVAVREKLRLLGEKRKVSRIGMDILRYIFEEIKVTSISGISGDEQVIDLTEARWESKSRLGEIFGLSAKTISNAESALRSKGLLATSGVVGSTKREFAFGPEAITFLTGQHVAPVNKTTKKENDEKGIPDPG